MGNQLAKRFGRDESTRELKEYLSHIHPNFKKPLKRLLTSYPSKVYEITQEIIQKKNVQLDDYYLPNIVSEFYKNICTPNHTIVDCLPIITYIYRFFPNNDKPFIVRDNLILYFLIKYLQNYLLWKNFKVYKKFVFDNKISHPLAWLDDPTYCENVSQFVCYEELTSPKIFRLFRGSQNDFLIYIIFRTFHVCHSQVNSQLKTHPQYQLSFSSWRDF